MNRLQHLIPACIHLLPGRRNLFGILMILAPLSGALVLTWWLGAFALVFGVALIILAFQLRSRYIERSTSLAGTGRDARSESVLQLVVPG